MERPKEEVGPRPRGVFGSFQRLLATLLELVETRVALVATELEEQRLRFGQLLLAALVTLFLLGMATIFITLYVVAAFWETNRIAVLGGFALLYLVLAAIAAAVWYRCAKARPRLFDATISELRKDREQLGPRP
jgi:uncharacterized membrane protein YqjE